MNFADLYKKIADLDTPVSESSVEECGGPDMLGSPMGSPAPHSPPSLSVNINAQGMDDIEHLMKLIAKVNPDTEKGEPIAGPIGSLDIDDADGPSGVDPSAKPMLPPLKMLPEPEELDGDEDGPADKDDDEGIAGAMAGGELGSMAGGALGAMAGGPVGAAIGDVAGAALGAKAGDALTGDDEKEDESWGNAPDGAEGPETKDAEYMLHTLAGGMNKEHEQAKNSYRTSDNPYAMPESDLRAQIKAELAQRLAEAKRR